MADKQGLLPPMFILSGERSGSTLCRYILDTHPDIGSPGELTLGELCASLARVLTRVRPDESEDGIANAVRTIVQDIMSAYLHKTGKRMWCEKSPANLGFLEVITRIFPDARYICLYREFRDCARSCVDVSRYGFVPTLQEYIRRHPGNFSLAMAENWLYKTSLLLRFEAARPSTTIRVRYEDLVQDPKSALVRIVAFLGLPWEDIIIDRAMAVPHYAGGGDHKIALETSIHSRSVGTGIDLPLHTIPNSVLDLVNHTLSTLKYPTL